MRPLSRVRRIDTLFNRLIPLLGVYREHVVIAGGMARDLYRFLPSYIDLGLTGVGTLDLDIAVADPLLVVGGTNLHDLLISAGLRYHTRDALRERPPQGLILTPVAGHYFPDGLKHPSRRDPHVEFITQLRQPASDSNAHPQNDQLIAYTLDYVGLLLEEPVRVEVPRLGVVLIPHPLAYALQKVLIRSERQRNGQNYAKDSADAFKVVASLRSEWAAWRSKFHLWRNHPQYGAWIRQAQSLWSQLYDRFADRGAQEVNAAYPNYDATAVMTVMRDLRGVLAPPT